MKTPTSQSTSSLPPAVGPGHKAVLTSLSEAFRVCDSVSYESKPVMHRVANALDTLLAESAAQETRIAALAGALVNCRTSAISSEMSPATGQSAAERLHEINGIVTAALAAAKGGAS